MNQDSADQKLKTLQDILLAPVAEANKKRDREILASVENTGNSLAQQIDELEQSIERLTSDAEDNRRRVAENIADAIGSIGNQLREAFRASSSNR